MLSGVCFGTAPWMKKIGENGTNFRERRGILNPNLRWLPMRIPSKATEYQIPERQIGAVVTGFLEVGAVVKAVLFRACKNVIEPANPDVDIGVNKISLAYSEYCRREN